MVMTKKKMQMRRVADEKEDDPEHWNADGDDTYDCDEMIRMMMAMVAMLR